MIDQKLHRAQDALGSGAVADDTTSLFIPPYLEADAGQAIRYPWMASILGEKIAGIIASNSSSSATTLPAQPNTEITSVSPSAANTSQIALGANVATSLYGVTGAGLKIGVISDSFNNKGGAAADIAAGALPAGGVTVLTDQSSGGSDEGRAMIESAYQIAPGAQYFFNTGANGLAAAVVALQQAGCNVIIDDLSFGSDSIYQVGSAGDNAINTAVGANIDYFTSAGNNGGAYYEQGFAQLSTTIASINGASPIVANDFGGGTPFLNVTIGVGASASAIFGWAQPSFSISGGSGASNSLAVYLLDSSGNVVASGAVDQTGSDARQSFSFTNNTNSTSFNVVVVSNGTNVVPSGELFKFIWNDAAATINNANAGKGSGDLIGQEFLPGVSVVGAVNYASTPAYGASGTTETYSSVGPGEVLYDGNGNLLATPIIPNEPQFTATDGTTIAGANSGFAGSPFSGTSQAAPNAGAVAALVLSANGALSTTQITSILAQSAIPVASPAGFSGAGLIQARAAVEIGANDLGARWTTASGANWTSSGSWSTGTLPMTTQGAILGDNEGGITGTYTVTVNTLGDSAGSLAIATPAGSGATLLIAQGGSLTIGGANTSNVTAGDFLVSDNGTLSVTGGGLTVAGSLNVNSGKVSLSSGSASASNYAQNAGSITVGGGGTAGLTLTDVTGFNETGGAATVLAGGTVTSTLLTLSNSTLTIAGKFVDAGALTIGTNGTAGSIVLQSGGELDIGGTTDFEAISYAGPAVLAFTSSTASVTNLGLNAIISNFTDSGDIIDLTGFIYNGADSLGFAAGSNGGAGDLTVFDSGGNGIAQLNFAASGGYTIASFALSHDAANHVEVIAACYGRGTRIATPSGEMPIEALSIGDLVRTASGEARPVRWLGHRAVDIARQPDPSTLWPILVCADAFAEGVPERNLWVSPEHALVHDGVLIPAYLLVNGRTVLQVERTEFEYWHVELDSHDLILAEGMPAETYLDCGNRSCFVECETHVALYPDFQIHSERDSCLPRISSGPSFVRAKEALLSRAKDLGHELTTMDEVHVMADGRRIDPVLLGERRAAFMLPPGCNDIVLQSRSFIPAHCSPDSTDGRRLGVCLNRLQIDGANVSLADDAKCATGWQSFEAQDGGSGQRWTTGTTPLPANCRLVLLDFAGGGTYWSRRDGKVIALFR